MSNELLCIHDLTVQYVTDGEVVHAVNGIDLELEKGKIMGLVGETGAGKTTTALAIMGLLPKYVGKVPAGEILFQGKNLLEATNEEMRDIRGNKISMIFQDPMTSLNPVFTVGSQLAEVIKLHNKNMSKQAVSERVDEILEMVGIPKERKVEYPHQFSGGMKQRIMIAIAIACRPDLLIADEPTTALDVTIQAQVLKMMKNLQKELGSSVLLITHDLGVVVSFCDAVSIMYAGEIVESGALEDVFDRKRKHHPYTEGLFASIPDIHSQAPRLKPIPGLMPDPVNLPEGCKFNPRCPYCTDICREQDVELKNYDGLKVRCHHYKEVR